MNSNQSKVDREYNVPRPRRIYLLIVIVALVILGTMAYTLFTGNRISAKYAPLVDATMEIRFQGTQAHLWFEEVISGDPYKKIEEVLDFIDQADWYAQAILEGGSNPEGTFIPIKDPKIEEPIRIVRKDLAEFKKLTKQRLKIGKAAGIGSDVDQKYDAVFEHFLKQSDSVEKLIQNAMTQDLERFRFSQVFLMLACLILSVAVGVLFHRLDRRRADAVVLARKEELRARQSEKWLSTSLESMGDAVITTDPEGKVTYLNPVAESLTGWNRSDAKGVEITDVFNIANEETRKPVENPVSRVLREGIVVGLANHTVLITKDGKQIPIADSGAPIKDDQGHRMGVVLVFHDILERKLAEQKIQEYSQNMERMVEERTKELNRALYDMEESRDRIDAILKSVADGLIVTDIYNKIILMNRAAEDLLNVRFSEVIDRSIDFAIQDKTLRDKIKNTLEKKKTDYQFDFELPGEDIKHPLIMRAGTSGIKDKAGNHTGIITIIHDVTLEREVDRMKTEFLSTAAHELRTPLTSILGFSELLLTRKDLKEEEKEESISYINKESVNLAAIVNDLLDISRLESGLSFLLNKEKYVVGDAIKRLIPYVQGISSKHKLKVVLPEEPVELLVDKEKMEQVLKNLLNNAVKYSPDGGTICLSAKMRRSAIEISVADQGIGMTAEQVQKIFDKFYRVDASDSAIEGTGLGMTIVKYIVEAHGGKVWVESELGKGTTVKYTIPI